MPMVMTALCGGVMFGRSSFDDWVVTFEAASRMHLDTSRQNSGVSIDGVAAASSDGGPTGGKVRGPPTVLEFLVINFRGPDPRK